MDIIACTTPTIKYRFKKVDPAHITEAYLSIKKNDTVITERDLSTATIEDNMISWTLTQEETIEFDKSISCQLNWLTDSGTRGASKKARIEISENLKNEVI